MSEYAICQFCGYEAGFLRNHLAKAHGVTCQEYQEEFPDADLIGATARHNMRQGARAGRDMARARGVPLPPEGSPKGPTYREQAVTLWHDHIQALWESGAYLRVIARRLNAAGLLTPRGKPWTGNAVKLIALRAQLLLAKRAKRK